MTDEVGESYGELGGQLPDASQKERGKEWARRLKEQLERTDPTCICGHGFRYHHDTCHYPSAPRGEACGCERTERPRVGRDEGEQQQ